MTILQPVSVIDQRGNPKQVEVDVNLCYCSTQNCNQVILTQNLNTISTQNLNLFFTNKQFAGGSRRRTSPVQLSSSFPPAATPAIGCCCYMYRCYTCCRDHRFLGEILTIYWDKDKDDLEDNLLFSFSPLCLLLQDLQWKASFVKLSEGIYTSVIEICDNVLSSP